MKCVIVWYAGLSGQKFIFMPSFGVTSIGHQGLVPRLQPLKVERKWRHDGDLACGPMEAVRRIDHVISPSAHDTRYYTP